MKTTQSPLYFHQLLRAWRCHPLSSPGSSLRAPLLWLLLPFMAGLFAAEHFPVSPPVAAAGVTVWVLSGWLIARRAGVAARAFTLGCIGCAAGIAGLGMMTRDGASNRPWLGPPREVLVEVEVEVVFAPVPGRKTLSGLGRVAAAEAHAAELVGQRVHFSVIRKVSVPPLRAGRYAMRGVIQARPSSPASSRGFDRYLDSVGVHLVLGRGQVDREVRPPGWFRRTCTRIQDRLEADLRTGLEDNAATVSLYLAMLLGEKAVLSAEQQTAFMRSGTFHIFSISGLHVVAIAGAIRTLLAFLRVPRRPAVLTSLAVLWLYVQITGGGTPAERAFLMAAFVLGAQLFRLPGNHLAALAAAALVTLLREPRDVFSAGFQLSYGVVAALIIMGQPLAERWKADWKPWQFLPAAEWTRLHRLVRWLGHRLIDLTAGTWAATLASMPATIGYFGLCTPGALLANLVIVPLSTGILWTGFTSLLAGLAGLTPWCWLANQVAAQQIRLMEALVLAGTDLPGVFFRAQFHAPWMGGVAQAAILGTMLLAASFHWERRIGGFWLPLGVLLLSLFLGVKFG